MTHITDHLSRLLAGDQTNAANATDALLAEIAATNLDKAALERLGRHVLAVISADLKSGVQAQKAMINAMNGGGDE